MKLHHLVMSLALSSAAAVAKEDARDPMTAISFETALAVMAANMTGLALGGEIDPDQESDALLEAVQRREEEHLELAQSQRAATVAAIVSQSARRVSEASREW
jgi:hypothetical protein